MNNINENQELYEIENEHIYYLESIENILISKDILIENIVKKINSGE